MQGAAGGCVVQSRMKAAPNNGASATRERRRRIFMDVPPGGDGCGGDRARGVTSSEWARVWPDVAARVGRSLRAKGVDSATAEDITQEVAARVLATGFPLEPVEDLPPLAHAVARDLAAR